MSEQLDKALRDEKALLTARLAMIDAMLGESRVIANGAPAQRQKPAKRNVPVTCTVPGCKKPESGPKSSFVCRDHRKLPLNKRKRYYQEWKRANK